MENLLVKKIIKAVVTGSSDRAGCCDDDAKFIRKLNKLADSTNKKDHQRLIRAVTDLSCFGIELEEI